MPSKKLFECLAITAATLLVGSAEGFVSIRPTTTTTSPHNSPWILLQRRQKASIHTATALQSSTPLDLLLDHATTSVLLLANNNDIIGAVAPPEVAGISYSKASYYTVLGLYLMSFPGLWSQIKRSTEAKVKRKTYVSKGEKNTNGGGGMSLRQEAGEIMAYMKSNNYEVIDAGETIQFRGIVQRSLSQAFFLTFCTALGLLSLALVLQIQFQDLQLPFFGGGGSFTPNWFYLALLSPYAGLYYWRSGDRVDDITVKLMTNEAETENEITVQGSDEELERMWRTLNWQEKGMVKIEGILS